MRDDAGLELILRLSSISSLERYGHQWAHQKTILESRVLNYLHGKGFEVPKVISVCCGGDSGDSDHSIGMLMEKTQGVGYEWGTSVMTLDHKVLIL